MKCLLYPKTYATVAAVVRDKHETPDLLWVRTDAGDLRVLSVRWRNGRGSTGSGFAFDFAKGTRIKIYQRPGADHPNFRRVGS